MTCLTRYVAWELLKVFLATLLAITFLVLVVGTIVEAAKHNLGPAPVLRILPFLLPDALRFAVPATILFAACLVFGRMSAAGEVVALKSLGISPRVFFVPALLLATLLSVLTVWLNDLAVSWGRRGVQRVVLTSVEEILYGGLKLKHSISTRRFSMHVKRVEGRDLIGPTVSLQPDGKTPGVTLRAERGRLHGDVDQGVLMIQLEKGFVKVDDPGGGEGVSYDFDLLEQAVPLHDATRKGRQRASPSHVPLRQIDDAIRTQKTRLAALEQQAGVKASFDLLTGRLGEMNDTAWRGRLAEMERVDVTLHRLHTEPWRRWASGFSCLCFVVVGAPLAIKRQRGDFLSSFFLVFLPVLLAYYPLLMTALTKAKGGAWPPPTVWAGNIVLALAGMWLIRRVIQR